MNNNPGRSGNRRPSPTGTSWCTHGPHPVPSLRARTTGKCPFPRSDSPSSGAAASPYGRVKAHSRGLCPEGCKIGPVVASDVRAVLALLQQAAAALDLADVIIDLPDHASAFADRLSEREYPVRFSTVRMLRGPTLSFSPTLHAIGTMELG